MVVAVLGCSTAAPYVADLNADGKAELSVAKVPLSPGLLSAKSGKQSHYPNIENLLASPTPALDLYREDVTHDAVVSYFVQETGSEATALPIMYYAERYGIPFSLVFSLAYVESRYRTTAVNRNSSSIDRGLFQLNDKTFRHLAEDDFFHPDVNTYHGMQYLLFCLKQGADIPQALAIYNAGWTRVAAGRTPAITRRHVSKILAKSEQIERGFREHILRLFPSEPVDRT
jgi:soluble lytic murein transglycosylase-like protein